MNDAQLYFGFRKNAVDCFWKACESVYGGNENIPDTTVIQIYQHSQPKSGTFAF